ncbi:hypothetical protein BV22DRAFT_1057782 [Leucogyrophana mollusca]|uniref:Uncharacterized protein n=1 Tax=Leucogyrophana mollusca TaxID=85980 RepID=A0ACB8BSP7_9AGAM|nr:hypothetical protein BV22DRAFT_1057782 [Leucogyrophana mollusca]
MDPSEIGRFGTLRLMKRTEPNTTVASFPIDDETVTFGRDPKCSVRLYYPSISALHAKIIFQDRKAFIVVLGTNGLLIDGCEVLPSTNPSLPTTVPVSNNSEIEIHKKRFIFSYPPKELRTALFMSPSKDVTMTPGTRRKALRMSMIQSAEVFTPRPSKNPSENLRILQSPLKPRSQSPLKYSLYQQHKSMEEEEAQDDEEEIVLVNGNHPHVVEEEKDLVILESVEVEDAPEFTQTPNHGRGLLSRVAQKQQQTPVAQLQTPRRRQQTRPSLHRAVLIRSAQRAVLKQEIEREEEEEEKEVEEFIADDEAMDEGGDEEYVDDEDLERESGEGDTTDEDEESEKTPQQQSSGWRKSIEAVKGFGWPFRSSSVTRDADEHKEEPQEYQTGEAEELPPSSDPDHNEDEPVAEMAATPARSRPLGQFMTPQVPHLTGVGRGAGRNSYGGAMGTGPRRVRVEPKWKITDIVVPMPSDPNEDSGNSTIRTTVKTEEDEHERGRKVTQRISEEERKAIQERRRSALTTPDPYFGGQVPGFGARRFSNAPPASPAPMSLSGRKSVSPSKARMSLSPSKMGGLREEDHSGSEEEEDTRSLLARMKKTVEEMKRRRSVGPSWEGEEEEEHDKDEDQPDEGAESQEGSDKENGGATDSEIDVPDVTGDVQMLSGEEESEGEEQDRNDENAVPHSGAVKNDVSHTPHLETLKHLFPAPKAGPSTPAVRSMRDLFKKPQGETSMQTPRMDGMRDMYLREEKRVPDTPVFEGVGELLKTPTGYRPEQGNDRDHERNDTNEGGADILQDEKRRTEIPTRAGSSGKAPVTTGAIRRKTPHSTGGSSKAQSAAARGEPRVENIEDDETQVVPAKTNSQGGAEADKGVRPKARLLRGRKEAPVFEDEDDEHHQADQAVPPEPKLTRTRKVKTEQDTPNISETAPKLRSSTRSKTTPVPVAVTATKVVRSEPSKAVRKPRVPTRQTPQPQVRSATPTEPQASRSTTARPGRKGKPSTDADPPVDSVEVPTRAPSRGKSRGNVSHATEVIDEGDDDDPLDSIGQPDEPEPVRTVKGKKGKANATPTIKEEDDEGTAVAKAKRVTPAAPKAAIPSGTSRTRAASAKKPTPAPSKLTSKILPEEGPGSGTNKENTPSVDDEDAPGQPAVLAAAKATRAKRTAPVATKAKETGKEVEVTTKSRVTRTTRSRA